MRAPFSIVNRPAEQLYVESAWIPEGGTLSRGDVEALEKLLPELKAIAPNDTALPMLRELYGKRRDEVGKK